MSFKKFTLSVAACAAAASLGTPSQAARASHRQSPTKLKQSFNSHDLDCSQYSPHGCSCDGTSLLSSVERALQQNLANRREALEYAKLVAGYESLTSRERELLQLLVSGLLNKQVAFELGITEYTVQSHRGHIMR
jgi:DNA-binding NarL/FixJ family response regulator